MKLSKSVKKSFRAHTDVSQYLIRYWQLCSGEFYPRRTLGKFYQVDIENYKEVAKDIEGQKYQMISINENCSMDDLKLLKRINMRHLIGFYQKNQTTK